MFGDCILYVHYLRTVFGANPESNYAPVSPVLHSKNVDDYFMQNWFKSGYL